VSKRRTAFTLIDVMIALALTLALLGAMAAFSSTAADAIARTDQKIARDMQVGRLFDLIESSLQTAVVSDARSGTSGLVCDGESLTITGRGVRPGLTTCTVRFNADTGVLEGKFGGPDGVFEPLAEGIARVRCSVVPRVVAARADPVERFDSTSAGFLPAAVVVEVWYGRPPGAQSATESTAESGTPATPPDRTRWMRIAGLASGGGA
jgi:type II secretory pathway component PulJ